MAIPVLILGNSGTGKSASMRNFPAGSVGVFNVQGKPFPFPGGNKLARVDTDDYAKIAAGLKAAQVRSMVVDDAQYLMANQFMRTASQIGYQKFTDMAQNYWNLIQTAISLPNDKIVYFLQHIELDANGNEKAKTIGKMLDEKITVEGMFTIVLKTNMTDGVYSFVTHNTGHDTVKSPMGMFEQDLIPNDLYEVDKIIRNYYGLKPLVDAVNNSKKGEEKKK